MSNTTNVVGYYNGNRYSVQIVASKFNVTLTLKPGEYILDRQGRKVNDPYFDVFATNRQLHRETVDRPVPIIAIPEVTNAAIVTQPNSPVKAVIQWTRDAKGHRQPVIPEAPQPATTLPAAVMASATESVKPMSMDEARRLGLVRKVREVPEDYGANDTTGLPPSGIPKMKYAIDPTVNRQAPPLPKEATALPKDDPNRQTRAQLVAGLAQSSAVTSADEHTHPFANAGVVNNPPGTPIMTGAPIVESEPPQSYEPEVVNEEPQTPDSGPEPDVDVDEGPPVVPPTAKLTVPPPPPLKPLTAKNQFSCPECGAPHKFRSQLKNHVIAKHPDKLNAIMAMYADTSSVP